MVHRNDETDARIIIDDQLRQAGWNPADKSQVVTEVKTEVGKPDYVLLDQRGRSLAVIEAKKNAIDPYTAKQQALPYAQSLKAPFIFLTNGELIYFWDYLNDDAQLVNSFFSRRDLERLLEMRSHRQPLATIAIPDYYQRQGETRQVRPYLFILTCCAMVVVTSLLMTGMTPAPFSTSCATRSCPLTVSMTFGRTELLNDQNFSVAKTKPSFTTGSGAFSKLMAHKIRGNSLGTTQAIYFC